MDPNSNDFQLWANGGNRQCPWCKNDNLDCPANGVYIWECGLRLERGKQPDIKWHITVPCFSTQAPLHLLVARNELLLSAHGLCDEDD